MPRIKPTKTKGVLEPPVLTRANVDTPRIPQVSSTWPQVPSDVLLEIASYLRDGRYALLALARVCDHWRQVLIECPLNWTRISTLYPQETFKLWLQRSKDVPIDAEIHKLYQGLLPLLKSNQTSFRSLRCSLNKKELQTLFGGLTKVSSNLERLDLSRGTADRCSPITFKIISGSMPTLKDLRLVHIDLAPEILMLRHLVHLKLMHPYPSLTATLDLIAANPSLETIVLRVKCGGQRDHRPAGAITVPRLRVLKFEFYSPLPLFHHISIPRGASVFFSKWNDTGCEVALPDSLDHLRNAWEVKNLFVQRKYGHWIEANGPSGELKFEGVKDPLPELLRLPLQFVEKFRYAEDDPSDGTANKELERDRIFKAFRGFSNLRTLVIGSCGLEVMKHIFRVLSPQTGRMVHGVSQNLLCPILSTVIVEAPRDGSWNQWVVPFLQMLHTRAAAGSRLKKVRIISCRGVQVPRPGEEKRRQMAGFVPWVEVKYHRYEKDDEIDKRRARELFEWEYGQEGSLGDGLSVMDAKGDWE